MFNNNPFEDMLVCLETSHVVVMNFLFSSLQTFDLHWRFWLKLVELFPCYFFVMFNVHFMILDVVQDVLRTLKVMLEYVHFYE